MGLALEYVARTDVGRVRANNEDSVFASPRLVAVADGVGGSVAGETASRLAIDALIHLDKSWLRDDLAHALDEAVVSGNAKIAFVAECRPRLAGMSTTLTAVAIDEDAFAVAHIGDSRSYLLRDGVLTQLTRDDSLVQTLIDSGGLTLEEARRHPQRSVVLKALDGDPRRRPSVTRTTAHPGDRLLVCSDGLSDMVSDDALYDALALCSREQCAERLVELALKAGGRDNVSVVVADVVRQSEASAAWGRDQTSSAMTDHRANRWAVP